jgi:tetratricopeptide (TPR) repeat protein
VTGPKTIPPAEATSESSVEASEIVSPRAGDRPPFRYRAFLSYSHRDRSWSEWLHSSLEHTRIDNDLIGRVTSAGRVPPSLRPIFRDREDFPAGASLDKQTVAALEASQFLVVLCSPDAARSYHVNEEVRHFKALGGAERIIPVIVGGEPGGQDSECFPPALRFKIGPNGLLTDEREEPIAADARADKDGRELAKQKVVAGLIGVSLDEVRKRHQRARRRTLRRRILASAIAATVLATITGYFLWQAREHTTLIEEQRKRESEQKKQLADLRALVEKLINIGRAHAAPGSEEAVVEAVNAAANGAAKGDARLARAMELLQAGQIEAAEKLFRSVAEEKERAASAIGKEAAAAYRNLGAIAGLADPMRAREAYARAIELDPADREALYWSGYLRLLAGDANTAEQQLRKLLQIAVLAADERGVYRAHLRLGDILIGRDNANAAREQFDRAHEIANLNATRHPSDAEWQRDLAVAESKIGDILYGQGDLGSALLYYRRSLAIADRFASTDTRNTSWQYLRSVGHERVAEVLFAQGDLAGALKEYEAKRAIIASLVEHDRRNASWLRDLAIAYEKIGSVLKAQGRLAEAHAAYQNDLLITEELAKRDPNNAGWQYDLSVSRERMGDILAAQGLTSDALEHYLAGQAIVSRLVKRDPQNTVWREALSILHERIGDALRTQGKSSEALIAYRTSLSIRESLAASNEGNPRWMRNLSLSHEKIGDALQMEGNVPLALESYRASLALRQKLERSDPGNKGWQRDVAFSHDRIGDALSILGDASGSASAHRSALLIRQRLAQAEPDNVQWQLDIVASQWKLASLGDDAVRRLTDIIATLRALHERKQLPAEVAHWLPLAIEQAAKLR